MRERGGETRRNGEIAGNLERLGEGQNELRLFFFSPIFSLSLLNTSISAYYCCRIFPEPIPAYHIIFSDRHFARDLLKSFYGILIGPNS